MSPLTKQHAITRRTLLSTLALAALGTLGATPEARRPPNRS